MKNLLLLAFVVFSAISCSSNYDDPGKKQVPEHKYQLEKKLTITSENNDSKVSLIASFDQEELMDLLTEDNFKLSVLYELPEIMNFNNEPEEFSDNSIPGIKIEIVDVLLPKGAKGFNLTNNPSRLKALNTEYDYYEYYADGYAGARVTLGNNGGQIYVRIGVLWTPNQWFYDNILTATLKIYPSYCQSTPGYTDPFYKMRVRVEIQAIPGTHTVTWILL
ncbi:MAG: hypothetical protein WC865_03170 [Bacteroidales bacterium]